MNSNKRKEILERFDASSDVVDELAVFFANTFSSCTKDLNDSFLDKWKSVFMCAGIDGAAKAINQFLVKREREITFESPESVEIELYSSIGGDIPVITAKNNTDFDSILRNAVYNGKDDSNILKMGAAFAFGKQTRFIVLSYKPYANIPAEYMGFDEETWAENSLLIRKHHECAHYFTKRFYGSSKNNLHDELLADLSGFYSAFGKFKAEWFLHGLGLLDNPDGKEGRIAIYTKGLGDKSVKIVARLAAVIARSVEKWTETNEFLDMTEIGRLSSLCEKEMLDWVC